MIFITTTTYAEKDKIIYSIRTKRKKYNNKSNLISLAIVFTSLASLYSIIICAQMAPIILSTKQMKSTQILMK